LAPISAQAAAACLTGSAVQAPSALASMFFSTSTPPILAALVRIARYW
jgi:hypothetical protein